MKKWIIYVLLALFAATTASAQWWKLGFGEEEAEQPSQPQMRRSGGRRPPMSEKKRAEMKARHEKMRAEHEAIQKLADAARNETDPVKKAELTKQLRTRVAENAEKMQAYFRKRLEVAEQGVEKMKERLAKAEKEKETRIDQHVEDLLSGKKPKHHKGRRSGKGGSRSIE